VDAVIIGAGAAGLAAARELIHAGKRVIVLESSGRIGGRIMTRNDTDAGIPVELGAEFVHGDAPETTRLLDQARLATVPVLGQQYRSDGKSDQPREISWKSMGRVFKYMNKDRKEDRSFQDFLDGNPGGAALRDARELARGFVQGFNGADASLISEKSIALQGDPTETALSSRRIINGYSALIDYLSLDVSRFVRLTQRVVRIEHAEFGGRVVTSGGEEYNARFVIIAVPLPHLQDRSISIEPEIPAMRQAVSKLVMGSVVRIGVVVKEAFWEKKFERLSYMQSPTRPINVWWTQSPLHAPLLVGWAGGPPAVELMRERHIQEVALKELAKSFRTSRQRIESLVSDILWHDWSTDPDIGGAYSYSGIGGAYASRTLAGAGTATVHFAGEAASQGSGGTVEGAIATGKHAAEKILKQLES
jgi:monoamine oxidase